MEDVVTSRFWRGKRVLVTGHTGFKGAWLSIWLKRLGAIVAGYARPAPTQPNLFGLANVASGMESVLGDVRNLGQYREVFESFQPEIVFHLAAQALVRDSYREPVETFDTNVMGTVHTLELSRVSGCVRAVVVVTSDKCYMNNGSTRGYRESDPLGGDDPYASSKGCAELVTHSYRRSFPSSKTGTLIASVRAGNVIGGGDWAKERLVPDIVRAIQTESIFQIRHPTATRPWQHVLEPLLGCLLLGEKLCEGADAYAEGWNFGPSETDTKPVSWVVERIAELWGQPLRMEQDLSESLPESQFLALSNAKAIAKLGWKPRLQLDDALVWTVHWYREWAKNPARAAALTMRQIEDYSSGTANSAAAS